MVTQLKTNINKVLPSARSEMESNTMVFRRQYGKKEDNCFVPYLYIYNECG